MFCIDGKCRCPVFFPDGENCDIPREPEDGDWCLTPLKEWPKAGPKYKKNKKVLHDFSTCAVVGSAGTMRNSNLGGEIDAHTAVFRFNEAPHNGYGEGCWFEDDASISKSRPIGICREGWRNLRRSRREMVQGTKFERKV